MSETSAPAVVVPQTTEKKDYTARANDFLAKMRSSSSGFFASLDKLGWVSFITVVTLVITAIVNISIAMNIDIEYITDTNEKGKAQHIKNVSWVLLILSFVIAFFVIFVHLPKKN